MTTRLVKETASRTVNLHARRPDPHGDRDYSDAALAAHAALVADPDDPHSTKTYTDARDAAHVAAPDPHPQYLLEVDAVQIFSFAGYGGMHTTSPIVIADIGLGWVTLPFTALSVSVPREITLNLAGDTFAFDVDGVFALALAGSFLHDEVNAGRQFLTRLWNVTAGQSTGHPVRMFTGRNQGGTNVSYVLLAEITDAVKGDEFRLEVGGTTDDYIFVEWDGELSLWNAGEWREPLPSS